MKMVKGRTLKEGQKVFVYFNLHKKMFSIRDVETGLVVAHTNKIQLEDVQFKVSEAGRQRVLSEKKKNVHAGVVGKYFTEEELRPNLFDYATYDPYKYDSFVDKQSGEKLKEAEFVILTSEPYTQIRYLYEGRS